MKNLLILLQLIFLGVIILEFINPQGMQKRYSKFSAKKIRLFDLAAATITILIIWQLTK
jgi:hypothetical protein